MKYKVTSNLFKEKIDMSITLSPKLKLTFVLFPGKTTDDLEHEILDFRPSRLRLGGEVDPEEVGYYKKLEFTLAELIEGMEGGDVTNPAVDKLISSAQIPGKKGTVNLFAIDPLEKPMEDLSKATRETKIIQAKTTVRANKLLTKIKQKKK